MIVALKPSIIIYDVKSMTVDHTIPLISPLPRFALSSDDKNLFLAYSDSVVDGTVNIMNLNKMKAGNLIKAHKSPVLIMKMNSQGTMIATTSCKGTIIRIFQLENGNRLFNFKRGLSDVKIHDISFCNDSESIIVTSSSGTLHIFDTSKPTPENQNKKCTRIISIHRKSILRIIPKRRERANVYYIDTASVRSLASYNNDVLKPDSVASINKEGEVQPLEDIHIREVWQIYITQLR